MQKRIQTPARNHSTYHDKIIVKSTGEYLAVIQNPVDKTLEVFKYRIEDEK
jgi:hypothetical protein